MRVILFGVGSIYNQNKELIKKHEEIVALIDNDSSIWGSTIDDYLVYKPQDLKKLKYDKVILMCRKFYEMKMQLLELEIDEKVIWTWDDYRSQFLCDEVKYYKNNKFKNINQKRILIITHALDSTGSSVASTYLAYALNQKNYYVLLAAAFASDMFIKEVNDNGIDIMVKSSLPHLTQKDYEWISNFDMIILNHLDMFECAFQLNGKFPVMIWLHEPAYIYKTYKKNKSENNKLLDKVTIFGVSDVAKKIFEHFFNEYSSKVLTYGIPDTKKTESCICKSKKIIFAVIGGIHKNKAQLDAVIAFEKLCTHIQENVELWIIGSNRDRQYYCELEEKVKNNNQIILCGEYSREQLQEAYHSIDIVLCPSLEETMSLVITEGMMYEKVCVVSKTAGISDYIKHGYNGFICEPSNPNQLAELLVEIIKRKKEFSLIGKKARDTYEEYFTMEKFAERADRCVQETIEWFNIKKV